MSFLFLFSFYLVLQLAFAKLNRNLVQTRIFNGYPASDALIPYQGYLSYNGGIRCSGTIFHSRWALTAAHCVSQEANPSFTVGTIYVGGSDGKTYGIESFNVHPNFEKGVTGNFPLTSGKTIAVYDICLIQLASDIQFDTYKIRSIPLDRDTTAHYEHQIALVSGWGLQYGQVASTTLLHALVPVISFNECNNAVAYYLSDELTLCTTTNANLQHPCPGDSGAPLVANRQLIGITSAGSDAECGPVTKPVIYTRVSTFLPWIQQILATHGDYI